MIALPIDAALPEILAALELSGDQDGNGDSGALVLLAAPGAGKTTRVPPALLDHLPGRILVVEPRRVATRAAAARVASERGQEPGEEVGYRMRFETRTSARTRLEFVTEGIAIQILQNDPFLEGWDAVVLDEFHERRLNSDLLLAMVERVRREARPELRLVVMSATLEPEPIAAFVDGAKIVRVPGKTYPVRVEYLARPDDRRLEAQIGAAVGRALLETDGSVLVFLPGVGEIQRAKEHLQDATDVLVLPLSGDLPMAEQQRALARSAQPRIVLATNVAETSVTVEGVTAVVDSGLARSLRLDPGTGLDRLERVRISKSSADQRAGRAGREAPGVAYRLWTEGEHAALRAHDTAEIARVDLTAPLLQLLAWGEADPVAFPWFEAPDRARAERAVVLLTDLGAFRPGGGLTPLGRQMARLPVHPRIARFLVASKAHDAEPGFLERATRVAALLEERDPFRRPQGADRRGTSLSSVAPTRSDLYDRLLAIEELADKQRARPPLLAARGRQILRAAKQHARALRRVEPEGLERLRDEELAPPEKTTEPSVAQDLDFFDRALVRSFPDRVARRRRHDPARGVLVGGRGVRLSPDCGVRDAPLFLCLRVGGSGGEGVVYMASAVRASDLPQQALDTRRIALWDSEGGRARAFERQLFHDLVLEEREVPVEPEEAEALLLDVARADPAAVLAVGTEPTASFLLRLRALAVWCPELELPDPEILLADALPAMCRGKRSLAELARVPLLDTIRGLIPYPLLAEIDRLAPLELELSNGLRARLEYRAAGEPPVLAQKIQRLFGVARTPTVADGRVPVLVHLLAPNGRPQQITSDLENFWRTTYRDVKKDLAGRYPKHAWPDDPTTAVPPQRRRR